MNHCEQIKQLLADHESPALEAALSNQPDLQAHLQTCESCQKLLGAWQQIPAWLEQLPEHHPDEALLQQVRDRMALPRPVAVSRRRRFLAPSLASAAVLLAAIGLSRELLMREGPQIPLPPARERVVGQIAESPQSEAPSTYFKDLPEGRENQATSELQSDDLQDTLDESAAFRSDDARFAAEPAEKRDALTAGLRRQTAKEGEALRSSEQWREEDLAAAAPVTASVTAQDTDKAPTPAAPPAKTAAKTVGETKAEAEWLDQEEKISVDQVELEKSKRAKQQPVDRPASPEEGKTLREVNEQVAGGKAAEQDHGSAAPIRGGADGYAGAFDFLRHYQQTEQLQFQPATGYWANTYIPGDPEIRLLSARLAQFDRSWLSSDVALEQTVQPVSQPFDAPADNALALSVMADANAISTHAGAGTNRLRLQVGIRGIEHRHGQRPAMNVGVVIDLPPDAPDSVRISARALLDALLESKQAGDQFSLVITGEPGHGHSLVLPAEDFRFGPLQLARQIILGQMDANGDGVDDGHPEIVTDCEADAVADCESDAERAVTDAPGFVAPISLYGAVERAAALVLQTDDPSRPLGSSSVLLISAQSMAKNSRDFEQLTQLVHDRARQGVTLSVFPLGNQPDSDQVDDLVLAGLGHRRFLEAANQAPALVEDELHAASRAVARAARLSVRLAPGVKLVGVVGSTRLDTRQAQRVRDIEQSMDRRLSANLGIQSDRGEDEDGIQIVIPSIYSGDNVTVLLDLVTDRPGAIADVSLRYKDLVFLRNGSLQGHLDLPSGELNRGPLELAVLKNLLAQHFVTAVEQAAAALGRQQPDAAAAVLRELHATLGQARAELPAWSNDPDLLRDQRVLEHYLAALAAPEAGAHQLFLVDSLQFAAWAKTHHRLPEHAAPGGVQE